MPKGIKRKKSTFSQDSLRESFVKSLDPEGFMTSGSFSFVQSLTKGDLRDLLLNCQLSGYIRSSIRGNSKTYKCYDPCVCPRIRAGIQCPYCYVKFSSAIQSLNILPYSYSREISTMAQKTIEELNRHGGIRMFSFGDYDSSIENIDFEIDLFLSDCEKRGLRVKAITKNLEFVEKYRNDKRISTINISIDRFLINNEDYYNKALEYSRAFPHIYLRSVILTDEDLLDDRLTKNCVVTFGHGGNSYQNAGKKAIGKNFQIWEEEEKVNIAKERDLSACCITGDLKKTCRNDIEGLMRTCKNCHFNCRAKKEN